MILDKQAEGVLSSAEERKQSSGQTHMVANLLLQGDLYCKATNERKEEKLSFVPTCYIIWSKTYQSLLFLVLPDLLIK